MNAAISRRFIKLDRGNTTPLPAPRERRGDTGASPEKGPRQPTDAAAGENDDRSLPAGEGRRTGRAERSDAMLQVEAEIAGEGETEAKAAMASDGEEGDGSERRSGGGFGWRGGEWRGRSGGFEPDNVWLLRPIGLCLAGRK